MDLEVGNYDSALALQFAACVVMKTTSSSVRGVAFKPDLSS